MLAMQAQHNVKSNTSSRLIFCVCVCVFMWAYHNEVIMEANGQGVGLVQPMRATLWRSYGLRSRNRPRSETYTEPEKQRGLSRPSSFFMPTMTYCILADLFKHDTKYSWVNLNNNKTHNMKSQLTTAMHVQSVPV